MLTYSDPSKAVYIEEFISKGQSNYMNLDNSQNYGQYVDEAFAVPLENIFFYKYRGLLLENSETLVLNEANYIKYRFKPKKFAYDFYGSVEYWYILMILNNASRLSQFNFREIKYIPMNKISIIESILRRELENKEIKKIEIL